MLCLLLVVVAVAVASEPPLTWPRLDAWLKNLTDSLLNPNLGRLYEAGRRLRLEPGCEDALARTLLAFRNAKRWAVRMLDASGKVPGGILEGTVLSLGSFDECLSLRADPLRGRYCMVGFRSPLFAPLHLRTPDGRTYLEAYGRPPEWASHLLQRAGGFLKRTAFWFGICVPSACSQEDVAKLARYVSSPLSFEVTVADCQIDEPYVWPTHVLVAVCVLGLLVLLCVAGSGADAWARYRRIDGWPGLRAFSVYANTEQLFSCSSGEEDPLAFFHGIRFLSATWIILGHTYFFTDTWKYLKYRHLMGVDELFDGYWPTAVLENFTVPVGSFFFMSGFLMAYTNWKKLEKTDGRLDPFRFIIHKYWRMTPALLLMMLLLFAMPLVDSGPLWNSTLGPPIEACRNAWWTNLLYINNWWNGDQYCLIHTWYLAALMQFHGVAVVLLMLAYRCPRMGVASLVSLTAAGLAVTGLLAARHDYPMPAPAVVKDMDLMMDYYSRIYIKPFAHVPSYTVGMLSGYLYLRRPAPLLGRVSVAVGWILATCCALASVYGLYGPSESVALRAAYIAAHRVGWALGLAWLAYACTSDRGGVVRRLLSWRALKPLGDLGYLAYLLHPLVIVYRNASIRERVYYGHTEMVFSFLSTTVVSFGLAYLGYVGVERPFCLLDAMLLRPKHPDPRVR